AELSDEFYFQVDPQFNNIFRDSVDVIKSFHSIFFPETLNCCYYMTTDGFHVTYDKKIGVKFLNGSTVFRLYSGSNGIFEIEDSASKIVVKHGSQTLKCEQAT
ncbi:MAG: hypothetical protein NZT61_07450, partial [Deltaproteobacteria bacterium]|nr:hypothetical protein [Deltaproteobacteria bacterium]